MTEGYEKNSTLRAGGPLDGDSTDLIFFCIATRQAIAEFITAHSVWRGCEQNVFLDSERLLLEWAMKHGMNREDFDSTLLRVSPVIPALMQWLHADTDEHGEQFRPRVREWVERDSQNEAAVGKLVVAFSGTSAIYSFLDNPKRTGKLLEKQLGRD